MYKLKTFRKERMSFDGEFYFVLDLVFFGLEFPDFLDLASLYLCRLLRLWQSLQSLLRTVDFLITGGNSILGEIH